MAEPKVVGTWRQPWPGDPRIETLAERDERIAREGGDFDPPIEYIEHDILMYGTGYAIRSPDGTLRHVPVSDVYVDETPD